MQNALKCILHFFVDGSRERGNWDDDDLNLKMRRCFNCLSVTLSADLLLFWFRRGSKLSEILARRVG